MLFVKIKSLKRNAHVKYDTVLARDLGGKRFLQSLLLAAL